MSEISSKPNTRRLVDVSPILPELEIGAIKDSNLEGSLYNLTDYVRDVLSNYLKLKEQNPDIKPSDLPRMILK